MRIVLYTGYHNKPWSPNTFQEHGLGGTEQCVMFLAFQMAQWGYDVYVVGNVEEGDFDKHQSTVKYRNNDTFKNEIGSKPIDWIIAASYIHYLEEFKDLNYKHSAFWVHNTDFYPWWNGTELPNGGRDLLLHDKLDFIVCLTEWHKNKFIEQFPETSDKVVIIPNGVNTDFAYSLKVKDPPKENKFPLPEGDKIFSKILNYNTFTRPKKQKDSFIYTSHAERGLAKVLEDWPSIKQQKPNATLRISTPEYGLEYFEEFFLPLLDNLDDVEFFGSLPSKELYELLSLSEYWYYPSDYEETFCITALEMLLNYVKPITYETAGLKETLHGFNLKNFEDSIDLDAAFYYAWKHNWYEIGEKWYKLIKHNMTVDFSYIITIEDNEEEIHNRVDSIGIPNEWKYIVQQGEDAKKFTPETYLKYNVRKNPLWKLNEHSVDWYTREVTDGEVGCALSHMNVWVDTYADGRDATLILEDDFKIDYPIPWNEIYDLLDEGYDLIYLGRLKVNEEQPEQTIQQHPMWVQPEYSYNTHAYILSKRGAEILVEEWLEKYKQNIFALDEFFSIFIGNSPRKDILEQFEGLTKLKAAAPKINFVTQLGNRNSTEVNVVDFIPEIQLIENKQEITQPMVQEVIDTSEILDDRDWDLWCSKYINPYLLKGQYQLMTDEIGPNIIHFPLFTEKFCKELIALAESHEWVTDRHEFYPTTDQTMEMLGMQPIYQKVLEEFVYPIWIWFWELDGEEWKTLNSENFIAKYNTINQGSLGIHHDMSQITLNVRLNSDFKGGGTYIPRYKLTVQPNQIGWAMSHPGQITHKHGGRPVEEGTRYILVSFTNKN
jgi:glycosyltransferase involved in cell wall biosynthesis